jgi:hypothetical protein
MRSFSKSKRLLLDDTLSSSAIEVRFDLLKIEEAGRQADVRALVDAREFTIVHALSSSFRKTGCSMSRMTS